MCNYFPQKRGTVIVIPNFDGTGPLRRGRAIGRGLWVPVRSKRNAVHAISSRRREFLMNKQGTIVKN
jgi:hypothetical protein